MRLLHATAAVAASVSFVAAGLAVADTAPTRDQGTPQVVDSATGFMGALPDIP